MRRALKWGVRVVLVLLLCVAALAGYVYVASDRLMARTYTVSMPALQVPSDATSIARGKYLVESVAMCTECHGPDLGGRIVDDNVALGRLVAVNLTRGRGGLDRAFGDQDFLRVLMHGVRPNGRSVVFMPASDYYFTEEDAGSIVAYVRSVPAVDRELPSTSVGPMARALGLFTEFPLAPAARIDHAKHATFAAPRHRSDPAAFGEQLVATAACRGCHGTDLTGGGGPPPGGANLTPVGLGGWTERDFITAVRDHKRPNNTSIHDAMPRGYGQMTDEDLSSIFRYLQTVPPKGEKTANQRDPP